MRTLMAVLAVAVAAHSSAWAHTRQLDPEPAAWRGFAEGLPAGTMVAIRLNDGREIKGAVIEVRHETLLFKPRTRLPVPAADIAFSDIDSIRRWSPGMSPGAKVLAGVGAAAATIVLVGIALVAAVGY